MDYPEIPKYIEPDMLNDNCYLTQSEEVRHEFTEQELNVLKDDLFVISSHRAERLTIKKKVAELMADSIEADEVVETIRNMPINNIGDIGTKQLNKDFDSKLKKINERYEIKVAKVFGFDHQDIGRMAFYSEDGFFLYERPLSPVERQVKIPLTKAV